MNITPFKTINLIEEDMIINKYSLNKFNNELHMLDADFIKRDLLIAHLDFDKFINSLLKGKKTAVISGLSASGEIHLGSKIILNEMLFFQNYGSDVYLVIGDIDALLTRNKNYFDINKYQQSFEAYLKTLNYNPKKKFIIKQSDNKQGIIIRNKLMNRIKDEDFLRIYGMIPDKNCKISLLTTAADIISILLKDYDYTLVPIGIDEAAHIILTKYCISLLDEYDLNNFSVIFNRIIPGFKGEKMSKSKPELSILLSEDPVKAEKKYLANCETSENFKTCPNFMIMKYVTAPLSSLKSIVNNCSKEYCEECLSKGAAFLREYLQKSI